MPVVIELPSALRPLASGQTRVALPGNPATLRAALAALANLAPAVADRVLDERGALRRHVNVFLGKDNVRDLRGLDTPLAADAELFILPAVSGGARTR
jgi:sulfur-carrier protein